MEPSINTPTLEQPVIIKDKARYWQQHMEAWQTSDLTQPAYCQQHTISLAAFGYWRTRLKKRWSEDGKQGSTVSFLPVQLTPSKATLTLRSSHGLSLDLSAGFDPVLLKEVLQVLVTAQ